MTSERKKRINWGEVADYCWIPLPKCPMCGSLEFRRQRTIQNGDGTTTKLAICLNKKCGRPFKIVIDFPPGGNELEEFGIVKAS